MRFHLTVTVEDKMHTACVDLDNYRVNVEGTNAILYQASSREDLFAWLETRSSFQTFELLVAEIYARMRSKIYDDAGQAARLSRYNRQNITKYVALILDDYLSK